MPEELLAFLEQMLLLLSQGNFTTTYKYALLLALLDLCLEGAGKGAPPTALTTRQIAERMIEIYWPHSDPFDNKVLAQSTNRHGNRTERSQIGILSKIIQLRQRLQDENPGRNHDSSPFRARRKQPSYFEALIHDVEWILIKQPIPRLQIIGTQEERFLYEIAWTLHPQNGSPLIANRTLRPSELNSPDFDNTLRFKTGVSAYLIHLAPVLRPLIHRQWTTMVALLNDFPESRLEQHLFGRERIALSELRPGLHQAQQGSCFYCGKRTKIENTQIDHFLPWSRYPDDNLANLVLADADCNLQKTNFLADIPYALRWQDRDESTLKQIATTINWPFDPQRSFSTALMVYGHLGPGIRLWKQGKNLVHPVGVEVLQNSLRVRLNNRISI